MVLSLSLAVVDAGAVVAAGYRRLCRGHLRHVVDVWERRDQALSDDYPIRR